MIKELAQTLAALKKINNSDLVKEKVPDGTFEKQAIKLEEFKVALENYLALLKAFEKTDFTVATTKKFLAKAHKELMRFVKDIMRVDRLVIKIITKRTR